MEDEVEFFIRALERGSDRPLGLLAVALDHRVGHPLQPHRAAGGEARGSSSLASATSASARSLVSRAPRWRRSGRTAPLLWHPGRPAKRGEIDPASSLVELAREDQRQRDRAVEQVRAARLAGALDRAGDVEHVVEDLKGQPDPPGEDAERVGESANRTPPFPRQQAPRAGRRLRTARRSSARSGAGSARSPRAARRRPHAGAARPRRAPSWRRKAPAAGPNPLVRELGERAREQQVAGGDRHPAPGGRRPRWDFPPPQRGARRPRRRARASPNARAHRDRASGQRSSRAPSTASPPAGRPAARANDDRSGRGEIGSLGANSGGFRGKHDEQRAQALAAGAIVALACSASGPRGGRHTLQRQLGTSVPALAAASNERLDGVPLASLHRCLPAAALTDDAAWRRRVVARRRESAAGRARPTRVDPPRSLQPPPGGTVPWWITTMPPAVSR